MTAAAPAPSPASRPGGLRFRLFGIPIRIGPSFPLVLGLLGWQLQRFDLIAVFVAVGALSVLLHELGHAVAAKLFGRSPEVLLQSMGGLTVYDARTTRGQQLVITAAGPAIQIAGGLAVLSVTGRFGLSAGGSLTAFAADVWVLVSLLWGVLNLVPILPLDGGQLFRDLLPLARERRTRVAHLVSVVLAGAGLVWALQRGDTWIALLSGLFGWMNLQALLAGGSDSAPNDQDAPTPATAQQLVLQAHRLLAAGDPRAWVTFRAAITAPGARDARDHAAAVLVGELLRVGRHREAYMAVRDQRPEVQLPAVTVGQALATHPNVVGVRQVVLQWARGQADEHARGVAAVLLAETGAIDLARQWVASGPTHGDVHALVHARAARQP